MQRTLGLKNGKKSNTAKPAGLPGSSPPPSAGCEALGCCFTSWDPGRGTLPAAGTAGRYWERTLARLFSQRSVHAGF